MALVSVLRRYNFSKAELDGSEWISLDRSEPAKTMRLAGSLKLLSPDTVRASTLFPEKRDDYHGFLNTFRWTLGLEADQFSWPDYLASEALNVQLIFDVYNDSVSIYEAYGVLESLSPTRPIPESSRNRIVKSILSGLGGLAKESTIPFIQSTAPLAFSIAADSIPSTDSRDQTLWYLHRFYMEHDPCRHAKAQQPRRHSYGLEWRITNRLIRTVGSRIAGVAGVLFFHAPEPGTIETSDERPPGTPPKTPDEKTVALPALAVRMRFGLKPKCKEKEWMYFTWRSVSDRECPDCKDCAECKVCQEYKSYQGHRQYNLLSDVSTNVAPISVPLKVEVAPKKRTALVKTWPEEG